MLTKDDCMGLLIKLEDRGIAVNPYVRKLLVSQTVPLEVIQFISKNNGIEATKFYQRIRENHNAKRSPLYKNIVAEDYDEPEVITTLTALLNQITLFGKRVEDKDEFYKEVRAIEITKVLQEYFETGDITKCISLLKLVKADLLVLEYVDGRREIAK